MNAVNPEHPAALPELAHITEAEAAAALNSLTDLGARILVNLGCTLNLDEPYYSDRNVNDIAASLGESQQTVKGALAAVHASGVAHGEEVDNGDPKWQAQHLTPLGWHAWALRVGIPRHLEPEAPTAEAPAAEVRPQAAAPAPTAQDDRAAEALLTRAAARNLTEVGGLNGEALTRALNRIEGVQAEGPVYLTGLPEAAAALHWNPALKAWVWHTLKVTRAQAAGLIEGSEKHTA